MHRGKIYTAILILVQVVAIMLYPRSFYQEFPQATVLPPILVGLLVLTLIGIYTRVINPVTGRISMVFILGVNMVMRVITLFPNIKVANDEWNSTFIFFTLLSIALSWFAVVQVENSPIKPLPVRKNGGG